MPGKSEGWAHRFVETNGIRMHYVEQGEGYPVLLLHGFPELWYSWRYQIPALAEAGFHAIAPDLRGYGETDAPPEVDSYTIHHLVGDLTGLLDALGYEKTVVVGHDWGGVIVWQWALLAPERLERVVSLNTPFARRGPRKPTEEFKNVPDGRFNYILHFQEPGKAESEIESNLDGWFEAVLRRIAVGQAFITPETLKTFCDAFRKSGLTGPINYYRNFDRNWELTAYLTGRKVNLPSLMICADGDPILSPDQAKRMDRFVPNLRTELIRGCGHWTQQERPEEVNRLIIDFLADLRA
jgi:soluble epoxide hydrolase/lipid-phosphate phosphatase